MAFATERIRANLSQREVAEKIGISAAAVAQWETGQTMPRAALLPDIARLYGCTVDALLDGESKNAASSTQP